MTFTHHASQESAARRTPTRRHGIPIDVLQATAPTTPSSWATDLSHWRQALHGPRRTWAPGAWKDFLASPTHGTTPRLACALIDASFRDAIVAWVIPADADAARDLAILGAHAIAPGNMPTAAFAGTICPPAHRADAIVDALTPLAALADATVQQQALAVLASIAWQRGNTPQAATLARASLRLGPHRMSELLRDVCTHRIQPRWLQ